MRDIADSPCVAHFISGQWCSRSGKFFRPGKADSLDPRDEMKSGQGHVATTSRIDNDGLAPIGEGAEREQAG